MAIKKSKFNLDEEFDFEEKVVEDSKYCKKCKAKNIKSAKFCNECGNNTFYLSKEELEESANYKYCVKCQTKLDIKSKFCHNCGGNEFCESTQDLKKQSYNELTKKYETELANLQNSYNTYETKRAQLLKSKSYYENNIKELTKNCNDDTILNLKNDIKKLEKKLLEIKNGKNKNTSKDDIDSVKAIFDDAVEVKKDDGKKLFDEGNELYNKQEYILAANKFETAAKLGSHDALNYLGYMYSFGLGVMQDKSIAMKYYEAAIEAGNMHAASNLAAMYYYGDGVAINYEKAFLYNEKGANLGNSACYNSLGYMYQYGQGVKTNYLKALECYEKAAEMGNYVAFDNLFYSYFRGDIILDYAKALKWIKKGIKLGYANCYYHLGCCYRYGYGVDQDNRSAFDNFYTAAGQGHPQALFELGIAYHYGEMGLNINKEYAQTYFKLAAERGHKGAESYLEE